MEGKILIADDHTVVRLGVKAILKAEYPDIEIDLVSDFDTAKKYLQACKYSLVLLDINMKGSTYTNMISELKQIQKDVKILIFTTYDKEVAIQYICKGAEGYLNKLSTEEELKNAIVTILRTGYYYPSDLIHLIAESSQKKTSTMNLSPREFEIFKLLANGNGNLEISNMLGIQITTISTFKKKIFLKLGVKNIVELSKIYQNIH
ncbi:response regulator transcription factor [Chryseobacterium sediminis]|uniref:response regulator transcription factor n=1 Tax=Chryseobacterium sediminis TaxID=1679494 RepID=UPI002855F576|nr:response regulator transcription factor [Chryseobacterium sediminis]MDR6466136.1 DNA-binding NarL/FixJ family response regulator [Chryseobacterium sediminis]